VLQAVDLAVQRVEDRLEDAQEAAQEVVAAEDGRQVPEIGAGRLDQPDSAD